MQRSFHTAGRAVALMLLLLLGACAGTSDLMRNVPPEKAAYAPQPDKALIVFMRPSGLGFAIQSSVFDITDGKPEFIAVIPAKTKVAHYSPPGKRQFMVVSEAADFMGATLEPGKVYYALVTPRMGVWKARFSLRPVEGATVRTDQFDEWYQDTRWVENHETASTWAASNASSINEKKIEYLADWEKKPDKPMIEAQDGQSALYAPKPEK